MPLLPNSTYKNPPIHLFNGQLQTIIPSMFRKVYGVQYEREKIATPDGDFLNVDWIEKKSRKLVVITHGLEGDTNRHYILGTAKAFAQDGWDVLAWNQRSCGGELNLTKKLNHHGEIEDLSFLIHTALKRKSYEKVVLVGYSLGGSMTLKYLGVNGKNVPEAVHRAVVISVPCDLEAASAKLNNWENYLIYKRFYSKLTRKAHAKNTQFPDMVDERNFKKIKGWRDFDDYVSAPLLGFRDATEFYANAASKHFLKGISIPTLLLNAQNDPILTPTSYAPELAENHPFLYLETPLQGGHVGFSLRNNELAWSELRAVEFCGGK
jgi:uncharacterized protein